MRVLPSIKASFLLALRWILSQEGAGCDAFGGAELEAALRGGTPAEMISVNGPKDQATIDRAVAVGAKITMDHAGELEMIRRAVQNVGRTSSIQPLRCSSRDVKSAISREHRLRCRQRTGPERVPPAEASSSMLASRR